MPLRRKSSWFRVDRFLYFWEDCFCKNASVWKRLFLLHGSLSSATKTFVEDLGKLAEDPCRRSLCNCRMEERPFWASQLWFFVVWVFPTKNHGISGLFDMAELDVFIDVFYFNGWLFFQVCKKLCFCLLFGTVGTVDCSFFFFKRFLSTSHRSSINWKKICTILIMGT